MDKDKDAKNRLDIGGNVTNSNIYINSDRENQGSPKNKPKPPKDKIDTLQWVFIILLFIFFIALIFLFASNSFSSILNGTAGSETPTLTSTSSPVPTDTVPAGEPTSTPVTPTNTPEPTSTPIPPVPLGEDWMQGCISKLWSTYPSTIQTEDKGNGCLKEPVHAFSAENGDLDFLYERAEGAEEIYGLFAPLPNESGTLTLTIRLRDLSNADLLIGIFAQPEVKSPGLLMMMLNGGVDSNVFIQKNPLTYETIIGSQRIFQGNGYSITFRFDNLSVRSIINPSVFFVDPISIPASQKYLFLGYKGLRGFYRIEGTFLNFDLKE